MDDKTKRLIIQRGVIPFCLLAVMYYMAATIIASMITDQPVPEWETMIKYVASLSMDKLGLSFGVFDVPGEYADIIHADGYFEGFAAEKYHLYFERVAHPYIYYVFPYYLLVSAVISLIFFVKASAGITETDKRKKDRYLRAARRMKPEQFVSLARHKVRDTILAIPTTVGKLPLSAAYFCEHMLILGASGSGKSQILFQIVKQLIGRVRFIIVDRKGEFYSYFGNDNKDVLVNPYDKRTVGWNLFNEINFELDEAGHIKKIPPDLTAIADTIMQVKSHKGEEAQWYGAAANVFISMVGWCVHHNKLTTKDLVDFSRRPLDEIITEFQAMPEVLRGPGISALGTDPKSKTAGSVMFTLTTAIRQLDTFRDVDGYWSVRDWIRNGKGNLYLSQAGENGENYAAIVGLMIDLIAREIRGMKEGSKDVKLVFLIDELAALPRLSELKYLLSESRSKGVAVLLANQTISEIERVYGRESARNIAGNTKTKFFFHAAEQSEQEYVSKTVGVAEVERKTRSRNESSPGLVGRGDTRTGSTDGKQITRDVAFMPAEIGALGKGEAIAILPALLPAVSCLQFKMVEGLHKINPDFLEEEVEECSARTYAATRQEESVVVDPQPVKTQGKAEQDEPAPEKTEPVAEQAEEEKIAMM
jgi:type IV secretory pathway TraG/TraD family ATPase VirD4